MKPDGDTGIVIHSEQIPYRLLIVATIVFILITIVVIIGLLMSIAYNRGLTDAYTYCANLYK